MLQNAEMQRELLLSHTGTCKPVARPKKKMPVKPDQGPGAICLFRGQVGILQNRDVSDISLQRKGWIICSRACLFGDLFQNSYSAQLC